jgi:hypothetical protein
VALFDDDEPTIDSGFSAEVDCDGHRYLVQTQCSMRDAPVIESLVYRGGEVLVRITATYGDVAERLGFTGDDGRYLLEQQHADLVRKIRHGMLREDGPPARAARSDGGALQFLDAEGRTVGPTEIDDPAVHELLRQLGVAVDGAEPVRPTAVRASRRRARRTPRR